MVVTGEARPAPGALVFDVNETLLDLGALDSFFAERFGDRRLRRVWFSQLLQSSLVSTVTGRYRDFGTIGHAALELVAARAGVVITEQDHADLVMRMAALPAHAEVAEALRRLDEAGFELAVLGNSTARVLEAQLATSGLAPLVQEVISADEVKRLKPAPEPYVHATARLQRAPSSLMLVSAHDWDVAGALRVGCRAAFVDRSGSGLDPLVEEPPELVGTDLRDVALQLAALAV